MHTTGVALGTVLVAALTVVVVLSGCSNAGSDIASVLVQTTTSGPAWNPAPSIKDVDLSLSAAVGQNDAYVDVSHANEGYFVASATNVNPLKIQVLMGDMSYNYDLAQGGTPQVYPVNMGDGHYQVRVMQNTSGNNYIEIASVEVDVTLESEFEPFLHSNMYCNYSEESSCVALARELTADAENDADALQAVVSYVCENISYDNAKAETVVSATGYVPDPDQTLADKTGICFDYASLGAAMLRSVGIPCQIVTGYVSPDDIYHAWIAVYIEGSVSGGRYSVSPNTWTIVDLTFMAAGSSQFVGNGVSYNQRYVY